MMNSTEVLDKVMDYQDLQKQLKKEGVTDDTFLWVAGPVKNKRMTNKGENGFIVKYTLPFEIHAGPFLKRWREKHGISEGNDYSAV